MREGEKVTDFYLFFLKIMKSKGKILFVILTILKKWTNKNNEQ